MFAPSQELQSSVYEKTIMSKTLTPQKLKTLNNLSNKKQSSNNKKPPSFSQQLFMMNNARGKINTELYETEAKLYMISSFLVFL